MHPEARKQGLFSKLYKHAQEEALKADAGGLRLYVDSNNISAQAVVRLSSTIYRTDTICNCR